MKLLLDGVSLLVWSALWVTGGCLLAASLFRLRRGETAMVGLGIGLIMQALLANVLAHWLPVLAAFWLAAGLLLLVGILCYVFLGAESRFDVSAWQWLLLGILLLLFNAIGRGLAIFDDYQNLPTVSLMAAGDIPPHFALNPSLEFGYHYLLLLLAAQAMRLGNMFPWSALDLARGLILALPLVLAGLWGYRVTGSRLASFFTAFMLAFAGGARWLLLLLPQASVDAISAHVTLIGSAASSAPNLAAALLSAWKIDGAGPFPFPFAFYTGINQPYVMAYTGISGSAILILLLLLLTTNRRRHWSASVLTSALLAGLAIANEIAFLLVGLGFVLVAAGWIIWKRSMKFPRGLLAWAAIMAGAIVLAALQGGMLTEILRARLTMGFRQATYFDTSPVFVWPPAIVSAHLGSLSVVDPLQLVAALVEIGPVVIVTWLVLAWGWKSLKVGEWFEAALIASSWGALLAMFVAFKGPLFTATPRLMGDWFFACMLYFVPLLWVWGRQRSDALRVGVVAVGLASTLSGLVLFGVQLVAIQKPVYSTFITPMDAKMSQEYWNKLEPAALVLDPVVYRAPTVFGRFTNSSPTWYVTSPTWQALIDAPDPRKIRAAGFDYMYFDSDYWNRLSPMQQSLFAAPCVKQVAQVNGIHSEKDYTKDFRRLLDIRNCQ